MKADLHIHTCASDGNWTPAELIAEARKLGLGALAVTDHVLLISDRPLPAIIDMTINTAINMMLLSGMRMGRDFLLLLYLP
jgi:histidinol phosphatase-like PHP family hydrolase